VRCSSKRKRHVMSEVDRHFLSGEGCVAKDKHCYTIAIAMTLEFYWKPLKNIQAEICPRIIWSFY